MATVDDNLSLAERSTTDAATTSLSHRSDSSGSDIIDEDLQNIEHPSIVPDDTTVNVEAAFPNLNSGNTDTPDGNLPPPKKNVTLESVEYAAEVKSGGALASSGTELKPPSIQASLPPLTNLKPAPIGFRWPVRGRIISGFGTQANGDVKNGIYLAAPAGTPVLAASAGTVIYAGDDLNDFGNLILIQHENNWVSAYAHNSTLNVSRGEKVERGQIVATVGQTGKVSSPQLHFELRKNSQPVDPFPRLTDE